LTALGIVFAVSAVLRVGTLDLARADPASGEVRAGAAQAVVPFGDTGFAEELQAALSEIEALRDALSRREAELANREQAVATAGALVAERLATLEAAELRLTGLIAMSDSAAETDLDRLTRIYETMRPEQAAAVFEQMQPSFAAGFLARMAPAASAAVMAQMSPPQAYAVSVVIATRNTTAPRLPDSEPQPQPPADTEN
jgi:flagellar motility protein MotE (MotC chaperone)